MAARPAATEDCQTTHRDAADYGKLPASAALAQRGLVQASITKPTRCSHTGDSPCRSALARQSASLRDGAASPPLLCGSIKITDSLTCRQGATTQHAALSASSRRQKTLMNVQAAASI